MKYIITEKQLEQIESKILKLRYEIFGNDWDALQGLIQGRGNPPYILIGNLNLKERKDVKTLGSLYKLAGNLDAAKSSLNSLGMLKTVTGDVNLFGSNINSLGSLEWVGGKSGLNIGKTNVSSLGKLEFVAGDLYTKGSTLSKKSGLNTQKEIRNKVLVNGRIFFDINT